MSRGGRLVWTALVLLALAVPLAAPLLGPVHLAPHQLLDAVLHPATADPLAVQILGLRLPRTVLAFLAGACLAVAGAAFQTLLGNPLATPYTVGVASAGSFGAFLALAFPSLALLGPLGSVPVQALLWASLELVFLVALARRAQWGPTALVLAGVTLNFLFAGATLLVRLVASPFRLAAMERWLMGSLDVVGWTPVVTTAFLALPALLVLGASAPVLDQLALGPGMAHGRGVSVRRWQPVILAAGAWVTAAIVARTGPIAFVGLVVPHAVRAVFGAAHRRVFTAGALAGGAGLVLCDTLARTLSLPGGGEIPVGVLTALIGGPVFLLLLSRRFGTTPRA
ncbi:MAG: iron ABC transporter permease [Acidobacteria bacterium]|nr:iron ABC transporter permease [Acidobacteriota bacterium]